MYSQSTYQGQIIFEYSGTEDGLFTSTLEDSTISGFSLNQTDGDSSSFLIASVTQQDDNEFDLFLQISILKSFAETSSFLKPLFDLGSFYITYMNYLVFFAVISFSYKATLIKK